MSESNKIAQATAERQERPGQGSSPKGPAQGGTGISAEGEQAAAAPVTSKNDLTSRLAVAAQGHLGADELWELVKECSAEIERLREYEWMYKDLCK